MIAQPEDLAGAFGNTERPDFKALVKVRLIFREMDWCLTLDEERDLVENCHDSEELLVTIYVYDLAPVA